MSKKINIIARAVTHRLCPDCGYMVSQVAVEMMRFNFDCPKCSNRKISDFQPLRLDREKFFGVTGVDV